MFVQDKGYSYSYSHKIRVTIIVTVMVMISVMVMVMLMVTVMITVTITQIWLRHGARHLEGTFLCIILCEKLCIKKFIPNADF